MAYDLTKPEWMNLALRHDNVFTASISVTATDAMLEEPELEMPKSFGDALEDAISDSMKYSRDSYVIIKVERDES